MRKYSIHTYECSECLYLSTKEASKLISTDGGYYLKLDKSAKYKAFFRIKSTNSQSLILMDYFAEFLSFTDYFGVKKDMVDVAIARNETMSMTVVVIKNYCCKIDEAKNLALRFKDWLSTVKSEDNIHECIEITDLLTLETFGQCNDHKIFVLPNQSSYDSSKGIYKMCKGKSRDFLIEDITSCI